MAIWDVREVESWFGMWMGEAGLLMFGMVVVDRVVNHLPAHLPSLMGSIERSSSAKEDMTTHFIRVKAVGLEGFNEYRHEIFDACQPSVSAQITRR